MKLLGSIPLLFALSLVGQTSAVMYCCRPGCGACATQECAHINVCISPIFNTCCADERRAIMFENVEDYFEAVAAGEVDWED